MRGVVCAFLAARKVLFQSNLERRQRLGTERYNEEQIKRREILDRLLAGYNDGRRKTLFCLAANLLELKELSSILEEAEKQTRAFSLKERAAYMAGLLQNCAEKNQIVLKLRKKGKGKP